MLYIPLSVNLKQQSMARLKSGVFGGFKGKIGNVVGTTWKDLDVIRSVPAKKEKPATPKQLQQQQRFALMGKVMQGMNELLSVTFRSFSSSMSGYNSALKYNIRNAITGVYPALQIHYPTLLVSRGDLPAATSASVAMGGEGLLLFSWTDNTGLGIAKADDWAVLVCYEPESNICVFDRSSTRRCDNSGLLKVPHFQNKEVHTWLAFTNTTVTQVANSVYTGVFMV